LLIKHNDSVLLQPCLSRVSYPHHMPVKALSKAYLKPSFNEGPPSYGEMMLEK